MRLWSINPKYLDQKGLVALWREGLLAKKVLENKTRGYRFHPQLDRFKRSENKLAYINLYLHHVCDEADSRGYSFNRKILLRRVKISEKIPVKNGQLKYERQHLIKKLETRSFGDFHRNVGVTKLEPHPIFKRVKGGVEPWEVM